MLPTQGWEEVELGEGRGTRLIERVHTNQSRYKLIMKKFSLKSPRIATSIEKNRGKIK